MKDCSLWCFNLTIIQLYFFISWGSTLFKERLGTYNKKVNFSFIIFTDNTNLNLSF